MKIRKLNKIIIALLIKLKAWKRNDLLLKEYLKKHYMNKSNAISDFTRRERYLVYMYDLDTYITYSSIRKTFKKNIV